MRFLRYFFDRTPPEDETRWHKWSTILWPVKTIDGTWAIDVWRRKRPDGSWEYADRPETEDDYYARQW